MNYTTIYASPIIFYPASLNHINIHSLFAWALSSFKTYFIFKGHYCLLFLKGWRGKDIVFITWPRFTSEHIVNSCRMWTEKIMCLFSCDEPQREQEIGFACEPDFFTRSNPNSQYYYSKGQTEWWQIREEKSGQNTRQWGWGRAG